MKASSGSGEWPSVKTVRSGMGADATRGIWGTQCTVALRRGVISAACARPRRDLIVPMQSVLPSQCLACPDCDALVDAPALQPRDKVICPRCHSLLLSYQPNSLHRTAAFATSAAVLFVVSNLFPFLTLTAGFRASEMRL